jgi:CheY-like chemotaxis protein
MICCRKGFDAQCLDGITSGMINGDGRLHILVVEDSAAQRLILCRMLQSLGHHVAQASGSTAALALAAERAFDAVVTDISLPGMSGAALIRSLRLQEGPTQNALMIAVTAGQAAVPEASAVLQKPVNKQSLLQALAGGATHAAAPGMMLLDATQIAQLQADIGATQTQALIRRFLAEADMVCAQSAPGKMALHHLAGSAGLFGARALHTALLAGAGPSVWPATRAALLALLDQDA